MIFFKCKHPFFRLSVDRKETFIQREEEFNETTYHLFCNECDSMLDLKYAKIIGSVADFMKRGK